MNPINLINSNVTSDRANAWPYSLTTESKEKLIEQWKIWADQAEPGKGEKREMALSRLVQCLKTDSDTLTLDSLKLTSLPDNLPHSLKHLRAYNNQLTALHENLPD